MLHVGWPAWYRLMLWYHGYVKALYIAAIDVDGKKIGGKRSKKEKRKFSLEKIIRFVRLRLKLFSCPFLKQIDEAAVDRKSQIARFRSHDDRPTDRQTDRASGRENGRLFPLSLSSDHDFSFKSGRAVHSFAAGRLSCSGSLAHSRSDDDQYKTANIARLNKAIKEVERLLTLFSN